MPPPLVILCGRDDRFDDLIVTRAAAEISHHPCAYVIFGRMRILLEQRFGGNDLSGRADPTLKSAVLHEGALQLRKHFAVRETLDRTNRAAIDGHRQDETRRHQLVVDKDAAAAADANTAAFFRPGQLAIVAQNVK